MRKVSIIAAIALPVLIALTLVPEAGDFHFHLSVASLAVAVLLLAAVLVNRGGKAKPGRVIAEAAKPTPDPAAINQTNAEVVSFLATLQEKGRLVDFLMDDITAYNDAQVGAAARVVHEGCKAVLQEHFRIRPVREENEGSTVTYPRDIRPMNTASLARSAGEHRSRERWSIGAGKPSR